MNSKSRNQIPEKKRDKALSFQTNKGKDMNPFLFPNQGSGLFRMINWQKHLKSENERLTTPF